VPPITKESLASLADSLPRFGDMDPKSDMLASSGEDTIAFDSPENLSSYMHQDGQMGEQIVKVMKSSGRTLLL
jgi:hypothetical protein